MKAAVNAKVYKVQVLLGYLLLLPSLLMSAARTSDVSRIRGGGGPASVSEEDSIGRIKVSPRGDAPPMFYRALSRRSVGRYVLATSSLVGECARVYSPAPLSSIASSLCSRFSVGLNSRGRDARGSFGRRKSSGFSYDKFMSPDARVVDEDDPCGHGDPSATPVPPDKYGRVSSAFLLRHEIGGDSGRTSIEPAEKEETDVGVEWPCSVLGGAESPKSTRGVNRRLPSPPTTTGSVFKSIGSLGRDKRRPELDDMDLLSDSDDDGDGWDEKAGEDIFSREKGVLDSPGEAESVPATTKPTVGRNLVDVDDAATTLVNKLRLGNNSRAGSRGRNRRKPRE